MSPRPPSTSPAGGRTARLPLSQHRAATHRRALLASHYTPRRPSLGWGGTRVSVSLALSRVRRGLQPNVSFTSLIIKLRLDHSIAGASGWGVMWAASSLICPPLTPPLTHSIACAAQCLGCCLPCCWPASGAGGWMVAHYLNHNACLSLLPLGCWSASGVDGWVAARHLGHCAGPSLLPLGCWQLWSCPWCVKLPPSAVAPVPIVPAVVVAVQWPGG